MLAYLSKKIAIPHGHKLTCISWNGSEGYIACGGEEGLLKVLQLESGKEPGSKGAGALSMNQTLEGHHGEVRCIAWNEVSRKLTTSDASGLIIVWTLHKGKWFEEMINNRNKSVVSHMRWTPDGEKICIVYADGAVIVGSVDGNRLWGKELAMELSLVEWSPDGKLILFCTPTGDCHVYDCDGNGISKVPLHCLEGYTGTTSIVAVEWYDGAEGQPEEDAPALAIGLANGRLQISRPNFDDAVLLDTKMKLSAMTWNDNGSVLAVVGQQAASVAGEVRQVSVVQFYSCFGEHLRTLRVPGTAIRGLSWEARGLRLAMAVDCHIYFANVRPAYKWGFFADTLVYSFTQVGRPEHGIMFWDTRANERYAKYVKRLIGIRAHGDYALLATGGEEPGEYILILCNAIGSPVDSKYIAVRPKHVAISRQHVVAASEDVVYVWQYRTAHSKMTLVDLGGAGARGGHERIFHIDELPGPANADVASWQRPTATSQESITCVAANQDFLLVGCASGVIHRYSLLDGRLEAKHKLRCRPAALAINCDATRLSITDSNGVLSFFDLTAPAPPDAPPGCAGAHMDAAHDRKDVWDMLWAEDAPDMFACMEKARMYIFRNMQPEEPVASNSHLCSFNNLEMTAACLDDVMLQPEAPSKDCITTFHTRSLRDTEQLLDSASVADSFAFVEDRPHPRLWKTLGEHALEKRDFPTAEKGFILSSDYASIRFVKHIQQLDDPQKQSAELLIYFNRFDEAEALYLHMGRPDLAIELRSKLGDWFQVERLLKKHDAGSDAKLIGAWNQIGEYFADRHKWHKARTYFTHAKNSARLAECFYRVDDFDGLSRLAEALPEGDALLTHIGEQLQSVGLCEQAVGAFVKAGEAKRGIDCCVLLNQWDQATALAEAHDFPQTNQILQRHAAHLLDSKRPMEAIQLFRKAGMHSQAAKLLMEAAKQQAAKKTAPLLIKKLYVLAALEIETFKNKTVSAGADGTLATLTGIGGTTTLHRQQTQAASTLAGLMTLDAASAAAQETQMDQAWRGAEAYHFWILAHQHLYAGNMELAMRTALNLRKYEDILNLEEVFSFLALASFYSQAFGTCSKAFVMLESHPTVEPEKRASFAALAMSIFVSNDPLDRKTFREAQDLGSASTIEEAVAKRNEKVCVASGKIIKASSTTTTCKTCKHHMIRNELHDRETCPLCHATL